MPDEDRDRQIEINKSSKPPLWQNPRFTLVLYLVFILVSFQLWRYFEKRAAPEIPYSQFLEYVDQGKVAEAVVTDKFIIGKLKEADPSTGEKSFVTVPLWNDELASRLVSKGVKYKVEHRPEWLSNFIFNWILPFGLLFLLWSWAAKRMGSMGRGFLNIGNRVKVHSDSRPKVTFADVAGYDEVKQELAETVEFLKDPSRIAAMGARSPKGVLLVGPPGTGKTLLARAVAGEAGVPFFSISGSEFVELFVGVGAARVRELFEQARQKAPCIIFIDEIDAIGRARGAGVMAGGHDEREQTLNQLLTEMDGFDPTTGVVVMAATNRPEILDQALLRAGRFDRRILVDRPDLAAREGILKLYAKRMKLADDVDLRVVAQRTAGLVGADLENICNEAAIIALRRNKQKVDMSDFEAAIDRVLTGPEAKQRSLSAEERHRVAVHESGHTLVAFAVPHGQPVHKVTIIPRAIGALGFTLQLPTEDRYLSTKQEMLDQIAVLLGGKEAERLVLGDVSSGAANDLEKATEIARTMVTRFGMSEKLGPVVYGKQQQLQFLSTSPVTEERNYSEETARAIDEEIRNIIENQQKRASRILEDCRGALEALTAALEEKETLSGDEVKELLKSCNFEVSGERT